MEPPPQKRRRKLLSSDETTYHWIVYPKPSNGTGSASFEPGSSVFFRPKSAKEKGQRGHVMQQDEASTTGKVPGHLWIEYQGNNDNIRSQKLVSRARLVPVFESENKPGRPISIILTPETIPYRQLAASQIEPTDDILEIGCSTGMASKILLRYGRSWVGFDSSSEMVETCSTLITTTTATTTYQSYVCKMDALADPKGAFEMAKKFNSMGPTAVFLDVGGNRAEMIVVQLMTWILESFTELRLLVVKSRELVACVTKSTTCLVSETNGSIQNGSTWFRKKQTELNTGSKRPRHPLQAPLVYSPLDASKPICRYHNYDPEGCKRGTSCQYDHEHCHLCLRLDHRALNCNT